MRRSIEGINIYRSFPKGADSANKSDVTRHISHTISESVSKDIVITVKGMTTRIANAFATKG